MIFRLRVIQQKIPKKKQKVNVLLFPQKEIENLVFDEKEKTAIVIFFKNIFIILKKNILFINFFFI